MILLIEIWEALDIDEREKEKEREGGEERFNNVNIVLYHHFYGLLSHKLVSFPLYPPILIQNLVRVRINTDFRLCVRFFVWRTTCTRARVRAYRNEIDTSSFDEFLRGGSPEKHRRSEEWLLISLWKYNACWEISSIFIYGNTFVRVRILTVANYRKFANYPSSIINSKHTYYLHFQFISNSVNSKTSIIKRNFVRAKV